jgi:MFS family permease
LIALCGVGSTPIVLLRPITADFDKQRGLALGIALTGAGLAGFWVPNLVTAVIASHGWQAGYWAVAATAVLAAPIVWLGFRSSERSATIAAVGGTAKTGLSFGEARKTRNFALVSLLAFSMALGIGGMIVHLNPLFQDLGEPAAAAAGLASIIGISSSVSRLLTGLSLDRFPARLVTVAVIGLGTFGIALIWFGGLRFGLPGVILIGVLLGAELDLLAYLTSRLFGQLAFGAIYGWIYSVFSIGFGFGPLLMGKLHDQFGSYDIALLTNIALLAVAAMVAFNLGGRSQSGGAA